MRRMQGKAIIRKKCEKTVEYFICVLIFFCALVSHGIYVNMSVCVRGFSDAASSKTSTTRCA